VKTYTHLYQAICSFDNLLLAAKKAQKGKRFQENVGRFNVNLEKELVKLQRELLEKSYQPGRYREFLIYEPMNFLFEELRSQAAVRAQSSGCCVAGRGTTMQTTCVAPIATGTIQPTVTIMLVSVAPKTLETGSPCQDAGVQPFTDGWSAHATVQSPFRSRHVTTGRTNKPIRGGK
jgi:hypothetical protein